MRRASPLVVVALVLSCGDSAAPTTNGQDGGGLAADDASVKASGGDGGMQDASTQDAGMRDADAGCPADIGAAAGQPCNQEGQSCGGSSCSNPCSFCHIIQCTGGVWADREVFPAPCGDGGSEGGPDGGADARPEAGGGTCASPSDCRTFSDFCGGCSCEALGTGEPDPACDAGTVSCLVDPCQGHTATCSAAHRCAIQ
jgi:hypothetical protein